MTRLIAQYRCMKCQIIWQDYAGPTECPVCQHIYVEWVDYETSKNRSQEER